MTRRTSLLATLAALVAVVAWAGWLTVPTSAQMGPMMGQPLDQRSGDEFDKAFLDQMSMHHAMAVMMARPVAANATRQELRDLSTSIMLDQTREIAQMRTWARDWYGIELPDHLGMMESMHGGEMPTGGHGGHGGMMGSMQGGMMGEMSMMADLWKLPSNRLEAVFMSMMVPHHEGAIRMAELVPDRAAHQELKALAAQIIGSQSGEIGQMNAWLAGWYGL
jgi:uncharacterized protein (DUF305 family)